MNNSIKILEETKNVLAKGWTKFHLSVNDKDEPVSYNDSSACKHCLLAATWVAVDSTKIGFGQGYYDHALESLYKTLPLAKKEGIVEFNDKQENVDQIIQALDKAIEYLLK